MTPPFPPYVSCVCFIMLSPLNTTPPYFPVDPVKKQVLLLENWDRGSELLCGLVCYDLIKKPYAMMQCCGQIINLKLGQCFVTHNLMNLLDFSVFLL